MHALEDELVANKINILDFVKGFQISMLNYFYTTPALLICFFLMSRQVCKIFAMLFVSNYT